jgi:membrane dipeptidase
VTTEAAIEAPERFGIFDFGLSAEQEERAARLQQTSIIIDLLFQGPCGYRSFTQEMEEELDAAYASDPNDIAYYRRAVRTPIEYALRGACDDFLTCWDGSGITVANKGTSVTVSEQSMAAWGLLQYQIDRLPWLEKALTAEDIRRTKREGKHAYLIGTQMSGADLTSVDHLDLFYQLGLRIVQLTYNTMNFMGAGCTEQTDAGVSRFGSRAIARMNELGIIVDTGHCGKQTTLDACAISRKPVIASHTSAEAVYPMARAKSDEELKALAATGGVIGVYAVPFFLSGGQDVTIEAMLEHLDYIVNLVGWEHVGIGTDWPMQIAKRGLEIFQQAMQDETMGFRPEDKIDAVTNLIGYDDYRDCPNITRGLVKHGYSDEPIEGILGLNALRVIEQVCG